MRHFKALSAVVTLTLAIGLAPVAKADLILTGSGTNASGDPISATVDFSLVGSSFQVVLTNNDVSINPSTILTNLMITTSPFPATALPSPAGTIALTAGSTFIGAVPGNTLGEEWAYVAGANGGAASSGFSVGATAGGHGNLCGITVCAGDALDGAAYGLAGPGTDPTVSALKNNVPYVENSVTIDITLPAASTFTLADITSIEFQYGTASGEGQIDCTVGRTCSPGGDGHQDVPEPGSLIILGTALGGLSVLNRRRRKLKEFPSKAC